MTRSFSMLLTLLALLALMSSGRPAFAVEVTGTWKLTAAAPNGSQTAILKLAQTGTRLSGWVVPLEPGPRGRRVPRPPVRERTREAALQALRRVDPQVREALLQAMRRADLRVDAIPPGDEAQIFPTELDLRSEERR